MSVPGLDLPVFSEAVRRRATAVWTGAFPEGEGRVSTFSHALAEQPYTANSRFRTADGVPGTNPEELLAAAHASCFSMAFAARLTAAGFPPTDLRVDAVAALEEVDGLFTITRVDLFAEACAPGVPRPRFLEIAEEARRACIVTRALRAEVTLTATLV